MKLGTPNNPRLSAEAEITWAAEHGFDYLDLSLEPDRCLPEQLDLKAVRRARDRWNIGLVGHLPWYLPIGSPMAALRQTAVRAAASALRVCRKLAIDKATVHTHWPPHYFAAREGLAWQIDSLRALMPLARQMGVTLMLEPAAEPLDRPEHAAAILNAVPGLAFHLDLGHANLHGLTPALWIRRFAGRIVHVHAHDNNGRGDDHLPPGTGTIDWPAAIRALARAGYDGTITLESFSPDRAYRLLARDRFLALWEARGPGIRPGAGRVAGAARPGRGATRPG